jgi:hypothetical protein
MAVFVVVATLTSACRPHRGTAVNTGEPVATQPSSDDDSGGIGFRMTPTPGLGIKIAPGLVLGFDGHLGIGF